MLKIGIPIARGIRKQIQQQQLLNITVWLLYNFFYWKINLPPFKNYFSFSMHILSFWSLIFFLNFPKFTHFLNFFSRVMKFWSRSDELSSMISQNVLSPTRNLARDSKLWTKLYLIRNFQWYLLELAFERNLTILFKIEKLLS